MMRSRQKGLRDARVLQCWNGGGDGVKIDEVYCALCIGRQPTVRISSVGVSRAGEKDEEAARGQE